MDATHIFGMEVSQLVGKAFILIVAVVAAAVVSHVVTRMMKKALRASDIPSASIFINIGRALVWAFALLAVLQPVFGITPTAFVTALGVTSLVISLGLQDTISNIIGGLGLMAGRVVQPGDMVEVSGFSGEVIDVNWRSTTVRDRAGNEHVIPNSVLNKTALTRLTSAAAALCEIDIVVLHDANLEQVNAEVAAATQEALSEMLVVGTTPSVKVVGADAYGLQCKVHLSVKKGVALAVARDAFMREIAGASWLARA